MMEKASEAQYLSMLLLGMASFICGILPVAFPFRMTSSQPFFLSLILCLGAGVLLSTSLVHMLTDVQVTLKLSAQLYFCTGFLILYIFDEVSHYCLRCRDVRTNSVVSERNRNNYGSVRISETSPLVESNENKNSDSPLGEKSFECSHSRCSGRCTEEINKRDSRQIHLDPYRSSGNNEGDESAFEELQWSSNSAAETGLLIALLVHSVLEGVSIGVQTKISQIVLILGAVTFHKVVLSFCLGLELHYNGFKVFQLLMSIFLFSIGSPLGIFLGMTVTSFEHGVFGIDSELQAMAAGSLLYVAAFEVLPRERFKWQNNYNIKAAGILQLVFVLTGFMCITGFHFLIDPLNSVENKQSNNTVKKFDVCEQWIESINWMQGKLGLPTSDR